MNKSDIQVLTNGYKNFKELIKELCYPTTCILCGELDSRGLCAKCAKKNQIIQEPRCMCCGKPLYEYEQEYCNDCVINKKLFQQGRSLWLHKHEVKHSIYRFKYKNKRVYGEKYAELLVKEYGETIANWKPECILPIPVHKHRKRQRGYNQSEILAKALAEELNREYQVNIRVEANVLQRKKETVFQKKLDNRQRRKNLKGAFSMQSEGELPKRILIVDDIYTTGATLQEISKVLVNSGAENVFFLTISI